MTDDAPPAPNRLATRLLLAVLPALLAAGPSAAPFDRFALPPAWQERFWADPAVQEMVKLEPKALAALVPKQAGLRFCRCPKCEAPDTEEPLGWSPAKPEVVTCKRCGVSVPNDQFPAKVEQPGKPGEKPVMVVPTEPVTVLPGVVHPYPYHNVPPHQQQFADERLYLHARRDYLAREFLAKLALYAAMRYREPPDGRPDPALARATAVLLIRFAQVYPTYAVHYDQPGEPKFFQAADVPPPYRTGYRTAKWDWSGCQEVPLNLVIAYALIRDDPAVAQAGEALGVPDARGRIERDLFRAAAGFVARQPEEADERALTAFRGLLAVGRLLDDPQMIRDALDRLDRLGRLGFYHDGMWRHGDAASQRRVVGMIDGWIAQLLGRDVQAPMLTLARDAGTASWVDAPADSVLQAAWPAPAAPPPSGRPALLGGAGMARLSVGRGDQALDLELRAPGSLAGPQFRRLSLRLALGGRTVLGDLDDRPPDPTGFDRATASQNAVLVDGLNQRETAALAGAAAPGGDLRFFAADPDFQVAAFDDPRAYPLSTSRYRHLVLASAGPRARYALSVFEVQGGLQHDQVWHAAAGTAARWEPRLPMARADEPLLAPGIQYLPAAHAEDGRWFVQALGAFGDLRSASIDRPALADLQGPDAPGLRVHLLGDAPAKVFTAETPDPGREGPNAPGRPAMVVRRRSADGSTLHTAFVTVLEPLGDGPRFARVGRVASPSGTVVVMVETPDGVDHLLVNLAPGLRATARLADGRELSTDGLAVRVGPGGITLAGGTFAEVAGRRVEQPRQAGRLSDAVRDPEPDSLGWFEAASTLARPEILAGRALLIHHGDGTVRGWTVRRAENTPDGRARLLVREEPGFRLDPKSGQAAYYQFPGITHPGPHEFSVCTIARDGDLASKTPRDP